MIYGTNDFLYFGDIKGRGDEARIGVGARLSKKFGWPIRQVQGGHLSCS